MAPKRKKKKIIRRKGRRHRLYELEVELLGGRVTEVFFEKNPDVRRTIQIRGDQTMDALHEAIFEAFDRDDEHMYEFEIGGKRPMDPKARRYVHPYAMEDEDVYGVYEKTRDASRTTIDSLELRVRRCFLYWFDFGDDWWHKITVRAIHDDAPPGRYPKVTQRIGESPPQYPDWDEEDEEDDEDDEEDA